MDAAPARAEPRLRSSAARAALSPRRSMGPDGKPVSVYYRHEPAPRARGDRRRVLPHAGRDGLSRPPAGSRRAARRRRSTQKVLDAAHRAREPVVALPRLPRPRTPSQRYGEGWNDAGSGVQARRGRCSPSPTARRPPSRCASAARRRRRATTGHVYASGPRPAAAEGRRPLARSGPRCDAAARSTRPYATQHKGEESRAATRSRRSTTRPTAAAASASSAACRATARQRAAAPSTSRTTCRSAPTRPLDNAPQQAQRWFPYWWSREAVHFLDDLFASDRDFREILTGAQTFVNGPLAQFYRTIQRGNCCGPEAAFGMTEETRAALRSEAASRPISRRRTSTRGSSSPTAGRTPRAS